MWSACEPLLIKSPTRKINSSKLNYVTDDKKYYVVGYYKNLDTYDGVDIYLKRNDDNYIIKTIVKYNDNQITPLRGYEQYPNPTRTKNPF